MGKASETLIFATMWTRRRVTVQAVARPSRLVVVRKRRSAAGRRLEDSAGESGDRVRAEA